MDVIAHSHGGLVARQYLAMGGASVANLITLGTPHHGMFKTFMAVDHGISPMTFSAAKVRDVSRSFPSSYELLPTDPRLFTWNGAPSTPFASQGWAPTPAAKQLLADAQAVITALPLTLGVPATLIYGTHRKTDTHASATAAGKLSFTSSTDGDGTVPRLSAKGDLLQGQIRALPVPFGVHSLLFRDNTAKRIIKDVLFNRPRAAHFAYAFQSQPMFRPKTTNLLAVELRDQNGQPLPGASVQLALRANKAKVQLAQSASGDFTASVTMPGPKQHLQYEITATANGIDPIVEQGILFAGNY